jgi:uncharacterized membrane protein YfcA
LPEVKIYPIGFVNRKGKINVKAPADGKSSFSCSGLHLALQMNYELLIALCLLTVGFLYSSVGHGGASGYIAVLSIFGVMPVVYKPLVLVMNIVVAGIAFIQFRRAGYFKWSLCWPFLLTSIPFAFLGSGIHIHSSVYNLMLGIALIFPVIRLLGFYPSERSQLKKLSLVWALVIGIIIGFLSGMLNIGGGIFLSPVLILLAWANAKEAAAVSSLFIVVNSLSGLLGNSGHHFLFTEQSLAWFVATISGGLAGAYFGSRFFRIRTIQFILAGVLSIACVKLIFLT